VSNSLRKWFGSERELYVALLPRGATRNGKEKR